MRGPSGGTDRPRGLQTPVHLLNNSPKHTPGPNPEAPFCPLPLPESPLIVLKGQGFSCCVSRGERGKDVQEWSAHLFSCLVSKLGGGG